MGVSSLIVRGLGRSYGDSAIDDLGAVVVQTELNHIRRFDAETGSLECEAGLTLGEIIDLFLPRGFFPGVTPGTKFVTVGGAIAADVHGKNHHVDGTFSRFVDSFSLLTADGSVQLCSRTRNSHLFWATVGGMGLTGVILIVQLRLVPVPSAYIDMTVERAPDIDSVLEAFEAEDGLMKYSVAWIDCLASGRSLGRSVLMRGKHAEPDAVPRGRRERPYEARVGRQLNVPFSFPGRALNRLTVAAFNAVYYRTHGSKRSVQPYEGFFYPLDGIGHWNRIYGSRGFIQYQALFPLATSRAGTVELLECVSRSGMGSFLSVFKKTGEQSAGLLSFPTEGHTLAMDLPNTGAPLRDLVQRMDSIVLRHSGRLYLAKDTTMDRETFDAMYPRADEFRALKQQIDPDALFMSRQSRRLALGGAHG
jgi:decaprenylphospho-beta-D-ribofuranose 2-oxidase